MLLRYYISSFTCRIISHVDTKCYCMKLQMSTLQPLCDLFGLQREMAPIVQGGIKVGKAIPRGVNSKYQNLEVREEL